MTYDEIKRKIREAGRLVDAGQVAEADALLRSMVGKGLRLADLDANLSAAQVKQLREHSQGGKPKSKVSRKPRAPNPRQKRRNARMCVPGDRVEVVGESATNLRRHRHVQTGYVESCAKATVWVRLDDGHLWGAHEDDVKKTNVTQLAVLQRMANPDPAKIASAAKAYQEALGEYADTVRSGEDDRAVEEAKTRLDAAAKRLKTSLGPGRPITVMASAAGAAAGSALAGPVGAAAGAVVGGAVPLAVRTVRQRRAKKKAAAGSDTWRGRHANPQAERIAQLKRDLSK